MTYLISFYQLCWMLSQITFLTAGSMYCLSLFKVILCVLILLSFLKMCTKNPSSSTSRQVNCFLWTIFSYKSPESVSCLSTDLSIYMSTHLYVWRHFWRGSSILIVSSNAPACLGIHRGSSEHRCGIVGILY